MMTRVLAALAALLGLQALRALLPLLVYVLRDRFGWPTPLLGVAALAFFSFAGAAPGLVRRFGGQRALAGAVLALACSRALLQLWPGDPWVSLLLAALAVQAFFLALAALSSALARSRGWCAGPAAPFLFGAVVDSAIHALAGTRDLHWSAGLVGASALLPCLLASGCAAWAIARRGAAESPGDAEGRLAVESPVRLGALAWGPFLALHLEWFGNVARLSARAALDTAPAGQLLILGLATAFALACRFGQVRRNLLERPAPATAGLALLLCSLRVTATGPTALPVLWIGQSAGALLLARALGSTAPRTAAHSNASSWGFAYGGGLALFLLLLFAHYGGYDLPLALGKTGAHLLAAALLAWAALRSGPGVGHADAAHSPERGAPTRAGVQATFLLSWATAVLLAFVPGLRKAPPSGIAIVPPTSITSERRTSPAAPSANESPRESSDRALGAGSAGRFRAVSFNLHNGFDERGGFGFDSMMAELREQSPDVIALQEVSRGWVIGGCMDLLSLAREALTTYAVSGPTVDSDWGNAVFTRIAPTEVRNVALPRESLTLTRAVTVVWIPWAASPVHEGDEAEAERIRVLATHFHHRQGEEAIRAEQARTVVEAFPPAGAEILLGDFNALPDSEPLRILADAGWTDVGGADPNHAGAFTNPSREPYRRIDTILFRGPLELVATAVAAPWGSDHRAVIADFAPTAPLRSQGSHAHPQVAGRPSGQQKTR